MQRTLHTATLNAAYFSYRHSECSVLVILPPRTQSALPTETRMELTDVEDTLVPSPDVEGTRLSSPDVEDTQLPSPDKLCLLNWLKTP